MSCDVNVRTAPSMLLRPWGLYRVGVALSPFCKLIHATCGIIQVQGFRTLETAVLVSPQSTPYAASDCNTETKRYKTGCVGIRPRFMSVYASVHGSGPANSRSK
jgi:hypothetical protein